MVDAKTLVSQIQMLMEGRNQPLKDELHTAQATLAEVTSQQHVLEGQAQTLAMEMQTRGVALEQERTLETPEKEMPHGLERDI